MLLVDPELDDALADVTCERRLVIGADADDELMRFGVEPQPWAPDEDATATINYTSGTTARPKGVQVTHRNIWLNATTFGWHLGVSDRDVYLHTLPQFHCNGWGMLYAVTGMGGRHIILRKVDGAEILRRVERARRHADVRRAGRASTWCSTPPPSGTARSRAGTGCASSSPAPRRRRARSSACETELGWEFVQIYGLTETSPLLTINRTRAEFDELSPAERAVKLNRAGAPAIGCQMRVDDRGRGAGPQQRRDGRLLGAARGDRGGDRRRVVPHRRRRVDRRVRLRHDLRPQEGRDHLRRRERVVDRGRGRHLPAPRRHRGRRHRHPRREVGRAGDGARRQGAAAAS